MFTFVILVFENNYLVHFLNLETEYRILLAVCYCSAEILGYLHDESLDV